MKKPRACRHCGCTENDACVLPDQNCHWVSRDCCSNPICIELSGQKTHLMDARAGSLYATHGTYCGQRLIKKVIGNKIFHVANLVGTNEFTQPRNVVGRVDRAKVNCGACRRVMDARWGEDTIPLSNNRPA